MTLRCSSSLFACFLLLPLFVQAQPLLPGFYKEEYIRLMKVSAQFGSATYAASIPVEHAAFVYRSPVMGFDNCWELWQESSGIMLISIRGTTQNDLSWLANFYAAMVPATGEIILTAHDTFRYQLASDPRASVHAGWLATTSFLAQDILQKIDSCYKAGKHDFLIIGHSQGGAIAYLLTAHLRQLRQSGRLPQDIRFKTYCSAAPKPGNIYFAYDYEGHSPRGWSYNVVNPLNWVPQTPFTIQTTSDLPTIHPFAGASQLLKKQKWPRRWAMQYAYGRLTRPSYKAVKNYRRFLGDYAFRAVKKNFPGMVMPAFAPTMDYERTGTTVVLRVTDDYLRKFPQDKKKMFVNHLHRQYIYLAQLLPD